MKMSITRMLSGLHSSSHASKEVVETREPRVPLSEGRVASRATRRVAGRRLHVGESALARGAPNTLAPARSDQLSRFGRAALIPSGARRSLAHRFSPAVEHLCPTRDGTVTAL